MTLLLSVREADRVKNSPAILSGLIGNQGFKVREADDRVCYMRLLSVASVARFAGFGFVSLQVPALKCRAIFESSASRANF